MLIDAEYARVGDWAACLFVRGVGALVMILWVLKAWGF